MSCAGFRVGRGKKKKKRKKKESYILRSCWAWLGGALHSGWVLGKRERGLPRELTTFLISNRTLCLVGISLISFNSFSPAGLPRRSGSMGRRRRWRFLVSQALLQLPTATARFAALLQSLLAFLLPLRTTPKGR